MKRYLLLGLCLALSLTACGFRGGPDADPALLPSYRTELRDTTTATLPVLAEALDSTVKHGQFTYTRSGGDGLSPDTFAYYADVALTCDGGAFPVPAVTQALEDLGFTITAARPGDIVSGIKGNISMGVLKPSSAEGGQLLFIHFVTPYVNVPDDEVDSYSRKSPEDLVVP